MGNGNSHHQTATHYLDPAIIHEPPPAPYPDMNMIFKSIPKMMQVADDMHRMSNYIMDLRNMMFACSVLSVFGIMMFVLMKYLHGRKSGTTRRRQRRNHNNHRSDDSEQSSLSLGRPMIAAAPGGAGSTSGYRHYQAARPVDGWAAHAAALNGGGGADSAPPRVMVDSTSTRHTHVGTPLHGGGGGMAASTTAPLMMNSSSGGRGGTPVKGSGMFVAAMPSPEHDGGYHQHHYDTPNRQYPHHNPQQQQQHHYAASAIRDDASPEPGNNNNNHLQQQSPTATISPTASSGAVANGQLKRADPVKLVVEEMPYMEENNSNEQQE
ncbi:hypothetical protein niasHT_008589 [Heterodera trifolii]|uniref:Uncharacterized protein n=1 Tax=Heterodera trifolii TaxID=157864 RepID=A0ABD2M3A1_9BILA